MHTFFPSFFFLFNGELFIFCAFFQSRNWIWFFQESPWIFTFYTSVCLISFSSKIKEKIACFADVKMEFLLICCLIRLITKRKTSGKYWEKSCTYHKTWWYFYVSVCFFIQLSIQFSKKIYLLKILGKSIEKK